MLVSLLARVLGVLSHLCAVRAEGQTKVNTEPAFKDAISTRSLEGITTFGRYMLREVFFASQDFSLLFNFNDTTYKLDQKVLPSTYEVLNLEHALSMLTGIRKTGSQFDSIELTSSSGRMDHTSSGIDLDCQRESEMKFGFMNYSNEVISLALSTTNFKYVICIDASTCIAAEDIHVNHFMSMPPNECLTEKLEVISRKMRLVNRILLLDYSCSLVDSKISAMHCSTTVTDFYEKKPCHPDCLTCSGPGNNAGISRSSGSESAQGDRLGALSRGGNANRKGNHLDDSHLDTANRDTDPHRRSELLLPVSSLNTRSPYDQASCSRAIPSSDQVTDPISDSTAPPQRVSTFEYSRRRILQDNTTTNATCVGAMYSDNSSCYSCATKYGGNCSSCNATKCYTCTGQSRVATNGSCEACGDGYANDTTSGCTACTGNCKTCSFSNLSTCLSCSSPWFLTLPGNTCTDCSQSNYALDSSVPNGTVCRQSCTANCASCAGNGSCNIGGCGTGYYRYEGNLTCSLCMAQGETRDIMNSKCLLCGAGCATCDSGNLTGCTSCLSNMIRPYNSAICILSNACVGPTYFDYAGICYFRSMCSSNNCDTCIPMSTSMCMTCKNGFTLSGSNCVANSSNCTSHQFFNNGNCSDCLTDCATCSSGSSCLTCVAGKALNFAAANGQCIACPGPGYFVSGNDCKQCLVANCRICNSEYTCDTCQTPFVYNGTSSKCECRIGTYNASNSCPSCSANCDQCTDSSHCLKCRTGFCLEGDACIDQNQADNLNKFIDWQGVCTACDSNCKTCRSQSYQCLSCYSWGVFNGSNSSCFNCSSIPNCAACDSGNLSCRHCNTDYMFVSGSCVSGTISCDNGEYLFANACNNCSEMCATCTGPSECETCNTTAGYYKDPLNNSTCVYCNIGQHYFADGDRCGTCIDHCDECFDNSSCSKCDTGSTYSGVQCVSSCGPGEYWNINHCSVCGDTNCDKCNITTCMQCKQDYSLELGGRCVPCRDEGEYQYTNNSVLYCRDCDSNCLNCSERANHCTACSADSCLFGFECRRISQLNSSMTYFEEGTVKKCISCDSSCLTCNTSANNCTSCGSHMYLGADNKCHQCSLSCLNCSLTEENCDQCAVGFTYGSGRIRFKCKRNCASSSYWKSETNECGSCPTGCTACVSDTSCQACSEGMLLVGTNCVRCDPSCKTCSGSTAHCTSCLEGYGLSETNICVACTTGVIMNGLCVKCDSSCLTCNGSTSTDCLKCFAGFTLADNSSCDHLDATIALKTSIFNPDKLSVLFVFSDDLQTARSPITDYLTLRLLVNCSAELVKKDLLPNGEMSPTSQCTKTDGWSLGSFNIENDKLKVELKVSSSIEGATLVVVASRSGYFRSANNPKAVYPEDYLIVENVTVIKSALDGMIDTVAGPSAVVSAAAQMAFMGISASQSVALIKLFQALGYYIYIDCMFPSNFAKFLDMTSESPFNLMPNFFEGIFDNGGTPDLSRFIQYEWRISFFSNMGEFFTTMIIFAVVKAVVFGAAKTIAKMRIVNEKFGLDFFVGMFEGIHMELILSVMMFFRDYNDMDMKSDAVKYLVIVFVSLFSLFMISMYLFMGYTVSRLTDSYFKQEYDDFEDMKNESFKFWVEDKNMHGNIFQRHFNLIQLFKDIVFAALLYALYYKPLVLIILLTLIQAVFMACVFAYPPYNIAWMNNSLKITQCLYMVINLLFGVLAAYGSTMNVKTAYNVVGNMLIGTVALIVGVSFGFSTYASVKTIREYLKKNKEVKSRAKLNKVSAVANMSTVSIEHPEAKVSLMDDSSLTSNSPGKGVGKKIAEPSESKLLVGKNIKKTIPKTVPKKIVALNRTILVQKPQKPSSVMQAGHQQASRHITLETANLETKPKPKLVSKTLAKRTTQGSVETI